VPLQSGRNYDHSAHLLRRWLAFPHVHGGASASVHDDKTAKFRWACNHRLRNALAVLAHSTKMWNPWAADRYAHARARGHNHRRALRTLGRAISRIIWRCWQNHTPYDPKRHTGLQQHITVTIPSPSGPRPDLLASQRMVRNNLLSTPDPTPA
jgi:hypothetical protein